MYIILVTCCKINMKKVFYESVYVKTVDGKVLIKDLLGGVKELPNCYIEDVNIDKETLTLKCVEN